jgi:hypothetical protein
MAKLLLLLSVFALFVLLFIGRQLAREDGFEASVERTRARRRLAT